MSETLNPYLTFNGKAAEAMKFYQSVLGGDLNMQTFAEAKMAKMESENNRIVHARLNTGPITLMASDSMIERPAQIGQNVSLSLMGSDTARLTEIFKRLSEGGQIEMPLAKQFWGDTYGMCTDRFGIHWMVNISSTQSRQ